jgi:DNA primase
MNVDYTVDDIDARSEYVDAIKQAADIVEVVSQYASLSKKGENYVAFCPFEEIPPAGIRSFIVNPKYQLYKCFCCGACGDPVKFLMDMNGIGYSEALRTLADKYQIKINPVI